MILISDDEDPLFENCPVNQIFTTEPGKPTRLVQWELAATDNSGDSTNVTCDPASGRNFVIGQTSVTCTASDAYGNNNNCVFYIDVKGRSSLIQFHLCRAAGD